MGALNMHESHCNPRIRIPQTDIGLIDLIKTLAPPDADPDKIWRAFMQLAPYKGYVIEKSRVKDTIADCLGVYVHQIPWAVGWRKSDWF
jgi:hypothetical protein